MGKAKAIADSKAVNDEIAAFFRGIHRNQLSEVKDKLNVLKKCLGSSDIINVPVVDSIRVPKSGDAAVHVCAALGHIEILRYLIEEEMTNLELINLDGKTALHDAAQFSQPEVVDFLLSKGANVNVVKKADWTPLMLACTKQNIQVVRSLVDAGANLHFVNKDGWTCLLIAAREGSTQIIRYLLDSCKDQTTREALLNKRSRNGRKPIHSAVMHGHLDAVKLLTEANSPDQSNTEDNCGSTPLMDACRSGFRGVVEFFLDDLKVCPRLINKNGIGLLHVSAEANQKEIIEFLVKKYDLDVNQPSQLLSFTPLHWACREGNLSSVRILLELGASGNVKDEKGRTPAEICSEFSKQDVYELLKD